MLDDLAKALIGIGLMLLVIGTVLYLASSLGLGRLPGDFIYRNRNVTVYIPLATTLLISIVLSLIFYLLRR